ncbi:4-alpha-glucanotransferase [Brevundimonas sp. PAMC22021]|uniref:4-alpha-glucanotransferase n=1 Tax=Brevundimonas sp. PAMC22021 TaxID=2861285 RepID=UPI001C63B021|nr:4-alpha-glucanotransferase [Brevundimonas sp. PAMC22021]QYF87832.1 4-alpha-glucanotransferase [Brevundimonas sp. PAMC22021]
MSQADLHALATAAGLVIDWEDAQGRDQRVSDASLRAILTAMGFPCDSAGDCRESQTRLAQDAEPALITAVAGQTLELPRGASSGRLILESGEVLDVAPGMKAPNTVGYHRLDLGSREVTLAVCPPRCLTARDVLGRKGWGATVQLYSLRDDRPTPSGDFGALADFAARMGRAGADAVAISPVHALFLADPDRYSPYSPSSRDWLNPLFADPAVMPGHERERHDGDLIDWRAASEVRVAALREGFSTFDGDDRFDAFLREGGEPLRQHALFEALHARFFASHGAGGWQGWPLEYQRPDNPAVQAFAREHADDVRFHLFCQWLADLGLETAQATAKNAGMGLGLIADLAVGLDPGGSHAWARRDELLDGLTLGAPPDAFQAAGQGWGITSFSPTALKRTGFEPFIRTVRAALRHAGGLRIDHALGLNRLWVLPDGASPLEGAYLVNPLQDLLRLCALESHRAGSVIIGEDLGVVPDGLRDTLEAHGLLGMRVLPFEREKDGALRSPDDWDPLAAAMTSTHDLAPVAGWWKGRDIDWRERLGAGGDRQAEREERADYRDAFWDAAVEAGVATGDQPDANAPQTAVDAAVAYAAASACELALIPVEDLIGLDEQPNLPGVVEVHPNWRRRLPTATETLLEQPRVAARIERLNAERPR